jgi:N-sulfoglucosamine sulfohydrolase
LFFEIYFIIVIFRDFESRFGGKMKKLNRRNFLTMLGQTAAITSTGLVQHALAKAEKKPNIVLIIADDCSHWDIGCYGSPDSITPIIDNLASEGMRFTQCFQSAPMCSPTRHNLYTGLYPVKTGAYPNHTFAKKGTKSVAHYLKPLGYRVALSGKTHISPKEAFPFEYLAGKKNPDFNAVDKFISSSLEEKSPFCLFLCSNEPHGPWDKGDPDLFDPKEIWMPPFMVDTPETRQNYVNYLAEINYLDGQVGQALALLKKHKIKDNTIFMFLSEQGNSFPFAKWTCYEVGVQSACIVRWPGQIRAGAESDAIIEYADILPTFIDAAGGQPENLDGTSLMPVLLGKKKKHKNFTYSLQTTRGVSNGSFQYGVRSVRSNQFRYIWNLTPDEAFQNNITVSKNGWWASWEEKAKTDATAADMVNRYQQRPEEELYDIKKDRYCMNNLADNPDFQNVKKELEGELLKWMKACGDKGEETEMEALLHQAKGRRKRFLKNWEK